MLTANQHYQKAHPNNNTQIVSKEYQYICLMAKSQTIEKYLASNDDDFYSKEKFIFVINTGLNDVVSLDERSSFDEIRKYLTYEYIQKD